MPLSLVRASCSSTALVFSGSFGSADSGMPMVIASCEPAAPPSLHCYLHTHCIHMLRTLALVCHGRCWCDGKLSSKDTPRSFPCTHGATCPAQLWPVGHLPCKHCVHYSHQVQAHSQAIPGAGAASCKAFADCCLHRCSGPCTTPTDSTLTHYPQVRFKGCLGADLLLNPPRAIEVRDV